MNVLDPEKAVEVVVVSEKGEGFEHVVRSPSAVVGSLETHFMIRCKDVAIMWATCRRPAHAARSA